MKKYIIKIALFTLVIGLNISMPIDSTFAASNINAASSVKQWVQEDEVFLGQFEGIFSDGNSVNFKIKKVDTGEIKSYTRNIFTEFKKYACDEVPKTTEDFFDNIKDYKEIVCGGICSTWETGDYVIVYLNSENIVEKMIFMKDEYSDEKLIDIEEDLNEIDSKMLRFESADIKGSDAKAYFYDENDEQYIYETTADWIYSKSEFISMGNILKLTGVKIDEYRNIRELKDIELLLENGNSDTAYQVISKLEEGEYLLGYGDYEVGDIESLDINGYERIHVYTDENSVLFGDICENDIVQLVIGDGGYVNTMIVDDEDYIEELSTKSPYEKFDLDITKFGHKHIDTKVIRDENKVWTIVFNQGVEMPDNIDDMIYVTTFTGEKHPTKVFQKSSRKLEIRAQKPYKSGAIYTLYVEDGLKSVEQKELKDMKYIEFTKELELSK
jgi:hypothetical protein